MELPLVPTMRVITVATLLLLPDTLCVVLKRNGCEGNCIAAPNFILMPNVFSTLHCAALCKIHNCCLLEFKSKTCSVTAGELLNFPVAFQTPITVPERNVALGKPTTAVPHYGDLHSGNLVDGNPLTEYHSDDTHAYLKPWALIDLQNSFVVTSIRLLPSAGNHAYRFRDTQILLGEVSSSGDFSSYTLIGTIDGPLEPEDTDWITFTVDPPICSRYVAVYKYIEHSYPSYLLQVMEIEVMTSLN